MASGYWAGDSSSLPEVGVSRSPCWQRSWGRTAKTSDITIQNSDKPKRGASIDSPSSFLNSEICILISDVFVFSHHLILQSSCLGELLHQPLLLLGEVRRNGDVDLDDEVPALAVALDALSTHTEPFSRRRAGRNLDRHLLAIERSHRDAGTECRLGNVEWHLRDEIVPFSLKESVGLDLEGDDEITGRSAVRPLSALTAEPQLRAGIDAGRDGDHHRLANALLPGAVALRTPLGRDLLPSETHRARTAHGESTLAERDVAASVALGARLHRRAWRSPGAMARWAFLVDLELHRHLAAERGDTERDVERRLD